MLPETYYAENYAGIIGLGLAIWNFYQLIMLFMFPVLYYNMNKIVLKFLLYVHEYSIRVFNALIKIP